MIEAVISLRDVKSDASRLLREIHDGAGALVLTQDGRASAVVQDYDAYRRQQQAMLMLKLLVQSEADAQNARLSDQRAVFAAARARLKPAETQDE